MTQAISKKETTAVEWLMKEWPALKYQLPAWLVEEAKAMEQQQIENAWVDAKISMINKEIKNAEEYYKEKYENL